MKNNLATEIEDLILDMKNKPIKLVVGTLCVVSIIVAIITHFFK